MAFANLFVGLNSTRQDDKTSIKTSESSLQDRTSKLFLECGREEELMPADQLKRKDKVPLRKRQIEPSSPHSGPPKRRKGTQQNPWKIHGKRIEDDKTLAYRDFDSETKDYHVVKFDYEKSRMDFNQELDLYRHSNSNNKNTSVKGNEETKEQKKNRNNSQQNQQSQGKRGQHSAKRGQKKRSRDFPVKDHSLSMTGRDWVGRNQVRANRDQYVKHSRMDGSRTDQRPNIQRSSQSQRGGKQFHGMGRQFKQDVFVKQKRSMTQEFRDQNVLDVDGRSICRHFVMGKCIKGPDCQLEHPPVVPDMIKEVCKFYVQGFCSKGECCPYMHKTFPCKFYHTRGKCFQADGCRFSHEPLTELTSKLLEGALQRDKEQTKDQPIDVHQPASTEESLSTEQTKNSPGKPKLLYDIQFNPLRPNFYNSSSPSEPPSGEVTTPVSKAEESTNLIEKDALTPIADSTMSLNNPSSTHCSKELVSYSVEAVLSQKPESFSNLLSSSITQVSSDRVILQRLPPNPSSFSDPKEVPYSDVLGSKNLQDNRLCGVLTGPISKVYEYPHPAKSIFEIPRTLFCPQANTDLPSSSANHIRNVSQSLHESRTSAETPFKCLFAGPPVGQSPFHLPSSKERHDPPEPEFKSVAGTLEVLKPTEIPFNRLFAGLVSQRLGLKQDSFQSIEPTPSSADFNRTVGLGVSIETPFQNHFAGPIGKTCSSQPCIVQKKANIFKNKDLGRLEPAQSAIHNSRNKDHKVKDPHTVRPLHGPFHNLFTGLSSQNLTTTLPKSMSPDHPSASKKEELSNSLAGMNGSSKAPDKPFHSLFAAPIEEFSTRVPLTKPNTSSSLEKQLMPESSINLSSSKPTGTNSILKTIFCRLGPCHLERANERKNRINNLTENSSLDSSEDARKDTICTLQDQPCVGEERDTKRTEGEDELKRSEMEEELGLEDLNKNHLKSPVELSPFGPDLLLPLHEPSPSSAPSAPRNLCVKRGVVEPLPAEEQQPSSRMAGTTIHLSSPGLHSLPVQSMALMRQPQSKLAPKNLSGPTPCTSKINENKLKNLFKTFDPTASPFGQ